MQWRRIEEQLYARIMAELAQGERNDGLWGKALAKSDGNQERARGRYIRLRLQALLDEATIEDEKPTANPSPPQSLESDEVSRYQNMLRERKYYAGLSLGHWLVYEPDGNCKTLITDKEFLEYARRICEST